MLIRAEKVVIITERVVCSRIVKYLESMGVNAYTIYKDVSGQGDRDIRSISGGLSRFGENIRIEVIIQEEEEAIEITEKIYKKYLHSKYAGIIYIEDVRIIDKE
ncbi:MAG: P-II family nitrogen regulator [Halothermotrichaceae bacterium]